MKVIASASYLKTFGFTCMFKIQLIAKKECCSFTQFFVCSKQFRLCASARDLRLLHYCIKNSSKVYYLWQNMSTFLRNVSVIMQWNVGKAIHIPVIIAGIWMDVAL